MRIKSCFERSPVIQLTKKEDTVKRLGSFLFFKSNNNKNIESYVWDVLELK
jgi:hypothetical protein